MYDIFRYLIDVRWLKQWKKYVGFESWQQEHMGSQDAHPGPMDNSCLFKGMHISRSRKFDDNDSSIGHQITVYSENKFL